MKIMIPPPTYNDSQHLVDSKKLMEMVDKDDLKNRKSKTIKDNYHICWFSEENSDIKKFELPSISIRNDKIFFINGRHRTVLLCRYLREIPLAVLPITTGADRKSATQEEIEKSKQVLKYISLRELQLGEIFDFPDLPILKI